MRMAESIPQTVPCSPACPPVRNHHSYSANRLLIDKINTMQCKNSHQRHCRRHRTSSNNAQTDGQDRPETELVQVAHNQKTLELTQSVVYFNDIYTAASLTQQQTHSHKQATHLQSFISHYLHTTNSTKLTTSKHRKQWCVSSILIVAAAVISTKVGSGCPHSGYLRKLSSNFDEIFWGVGRVTGNRWSDCGDDPNHDIDVEFYRCWIGAIQRILLITLRCFWHILSHFKGVGHLTSKNHSTVVAVCIMIQITQFFKTNITTSR